MAIHTLAPNTETLHGYFSKELAPVLTVADGDTLRVKTLDAGWGLEKPPLNGNHRARKTHPARDQQAMRGHALLGPVAIDGAKAGMTLEVQIGAIIVGDYGFTFAGGWEHSIHDYLGIADADEDGLVWDLDADAGIATNQLGQSVRMKPFMGQLGMPPPEAGMHHSAPPRIWGGNIDCKELVSGTTLYLPIPVDGALFSIGDGHAAQGDGEVSVQAIECPIDRCDVKFKLHEDMPLQAPRARTDGAWITFGFDEDLHQASLMALAGMVDLIAAQYQINRAQALALASPVVDLRVTQIANPVLGVHAVLRDDAIQA